MKIIKGKVLVKVLPNEVKKIGNLTIPDESYSENEEKAEVILANVYDDAPIEVGDKIIIHKGIGQKVKFEGEEYRLVNASEILIIY